MSIKTAILDNYQDAARKLDYFSLLRDHKVRMFNNAAKDVGQLAARVAGVKVIVLIQKRTHVTRQLLDRLPKLKIISQAGHVSYDSGGHIDLDACTDKGVVALKGKGSPVAPAELTQALVMVAQRHIPQYMTSPKHGAWQQSGLESMTIPPNFGVDRVLRGQTLGVFGYGKISQLVAGYGRTFGMSVLMWGHEGSQERARADGFAVVNSEDALFEQSDTLSVHLHLNDETRGIVTVADLTRMKPTTLFVSTSRVELMGENDLVTSLNRGHPGMAAIDIFKTEPTLQGHALLRMENCIYMPYIGYVEREGYELYLSVAFQNILNVLQGNVDSVVNPTVLTPALIRA